jgi:alpha-amylase
MKHLKLGLGTIGLLTLVLTPLNLQAAEQPTAIFHAFDQSYSDVRKIVCTLADQGYSHVQLAPAQKSNPAQDWWARYQPVDYATIAGKGSESDLKTLIKTAHDCKLKVIADVVFNHMGNLDGKDDFEDLTAFPGLTPKDFYTKSDKLGAKPCDINYEDGNRTTELDCWLGGLPDLKPTDTVKKVHKAHLKKLLNLGIDGFRFDAAKHMPNAQLQEYLDFINAESKGKTWNYLEVITDRDTKPSDYNSLAAITDFILYGSMKTAFMFGGDLRSLRIPSAIDDSRSVTFGRNHDTIRELNDKAINPYDKAEDAYLATAYVLARQSGTPLIFNWDNADAPYIKHGVKFRQILTQRGKEGKNVKDNVLAAIDSPTVLLMERGAEGFFLINKGSNKFDIPILDLTLANLDGCYRELRNNFTVAIERRPNGKKYITRWGSKQRGGVEISGRDALYFIREPFDRCQP